MMEEQFDYRTDILFQPEALQRVIDLYDPRVLEKVQERFANGSLDRVVIMGMGTSYFGSYPAAMHLTEAGIPVFWMDASELVTNYKKMITSKTLLWIISNSGKSIEITRYLTSLAAGGTRPFILANLNVTDSPLAREADLVVPIFSGDDLSLATRSLVGTLGVTQLMALQLAGEDLAPKREELQITQQGLAAYLKDIDAHLEEYEELVGVLDKVAIVGRGNGYAAALCAGLAFKEGPKIAGEAFTTGQFWHGPVELCDESYTVFTYAGDGFSLEEDRQLALKTASLGSQLIWIADERDPELKTIVLPKYAGIGKPVAQVVPIQLVAINSGKHTGFRPGDFRYLGFAVSTKREMFTKDSA
jgi:glucosamine--fructose-6-phosphate aminotransferase (isomerizing)